MKTPTERLLELNAREGYTPEELASFTCPRCGELPIFFAHPCKPPSVECRCCAPFVLNPEFGSNPWDFMKNSEQWGMSVDKKLSQPQLITRIRKKRRARDTGRGSHRRAPRQVSAARPRPPARKFPARGWFSSSPSRRPACYCSARPMSNESHSEISVRGGNNKSARKLVAVARNLGKAKTVLDAQHPHSAGEQRFPFVASGAPFC